MNLLLLRFILIILAMSLGVYLILINPLLFHFWIIPKIESRYGKNIRVKEEGYLLTPWASWQMPPIEISTYILIKLMTIRELPGMKNPRKDTVLYKLKEINYDVSKASNSEIFMSGFTIFIIFYVFVIGPICTFC